VIRTRAAGRAGIALADQLVASLTNFSLTVLVARAVAPRQFGIFALIMATYVLVAYVGRGLVSEPLITRFSAASPDEWRSAVRTTTATTLVFGSTLALVGLVVTAALPHEVQLTMLVFSSSLRVLRGGPAGASAPQRLLMARHSDADPRLCSWRDQWILRVGDAYLGCDG
jgi:O-antigen/teichoic acid export membrane protein